MPTYEKTLSYRWQMREWFSPMSLSADTKPAVHHKLLFYLYKYLMLLGDKGPITYLLVSYPVLLPDL